MKLPGEATLNLRQSSTNVLSNSTINVTAYHNQPNGQLYADLNPNANGYQNTNYNPLLQHNPYPPESHSPALSPPLPTFYISNPSSPQQLRHGVPSSTALSHSITQSPTTPRAGVGSPSSPRVTIAPQPITPITPRQGLGVNGGTPRGPSSTSTSSANLSAVLDRDYPRVEPTATVDTAQPGNKILIASPNATPYATDCENGFGFIVVLFPILLLHPLICRLSEWSVEDVAAHFNADNVLKKFAQTVIDNDIDGQILILLRCVRS